MTEVPSHRRFRRPRRSARLFVEGELAMRPSYHRTSLDHGITVQKTSGYDCRRRTRLLRA